MKYIATIALLFCLANKTTAQEFPLPLKPGKQFSGSARVDTLFWVLKNNQYNNCLKNTTALKKNEEITKTLQQEVVEIKKVVAVKDSAIADLTTGYERYKTKWETTDKDLEKSRIKVVKLRKRSFIMATVAALLGFFAGLAL